jgi:hypothetical protein
VKDRFSIVHTMTKAALTTWFLATTLQLLVLFWNQSAVVALVALPQRLLPLPRRLDRPSIPTRRLHNGDDLYLSLGMTSSKASKNDDCSDSSPLAFSSNGVVGTTDITSDTIAWSLPPLLSVAALVSYDSTRKLFHSFIDAASGHTWAAADGGKSKRQNSPP